MDENCWEVLTPKDIIRALDRCGYKANRRHIYKLVGDYDDNESGGIDFKEFLDILCTKQCKADSNADIEKIWSLYHMYTEKVEPEGREYIDSKDLMMAMEELGCN